MGLIKYLKILTTRVNPIKTLYFNFRMFDVKTAIKCPILIGYNVIFRSLDGKIVLKNLTIGGGIRTLIGFRDMGIQNERDQKTILDFHKGSTITFEGIAAIGGGARIQTKGDLILGENFYLSMNTQIIAHEYIRFGRDCTIGWDSLIMDTDFHKVIDKDNNRQYPMTKPIVIGDHCWICNNVQVLKGTNIPNDTIVGAYTLLNKRYDIPESSLLAGNPATVKKTEVTHIR